LRPQDLGPSARRHLRRVLESKHLSATSLRVAGPRGGLADPAAVAATIDNAQRAIALAFDLGVTTLAVNAGTFEPGGQNSDIYAAARHIVEEADNAGIQIAFGAATSAALADLLAQVNYDRARGQMETSRAIAAGEDPAAIIHQLHGRLAQVTLADAIRAGSQVRTVELGQGQLALPDLLAALRDHEFTGPLVVDVRDLPDGPRGAQHAADVLRQAARL